VETAATYGATSGGRAAADFAAGLGLIVAGTLVSWERPSGSVGPLALLLGIVWFAPDWVGWEQGPAFARSVAMVAAPLLLPLLVHLVLAFPAGRVAGTVARAAVGLAYGAAAAYGLGRALVRDPFLDIDCWSNCTDNVFLVQAEPDLARVLDDLWLGFSVGAGVLLAGYALVRLVAATRPGRALSWAVLVPAAAAALAEACYAVALFGDSSEDPQDGVFAAIFLARALSLTCLAAGLAWSVARSVRTRSAIARLAADLGEAPEPGSLRAALAASLGDARLEVAYRMPGSRPYVDAEGRPVRTPPGDGRVSTPIVRRGEPVALVIHDRALAGAADLEREIGAAARLAVDNERLRAEVLGQLEELRASRARIVEAADTARRRIERDLHDGAQQRLLTLLYELRLARAAADGSGDTALARSLESSCEEVQAALSELRELAHGIYPAVLTEAGLAAALATLADDAALPVEFDELPEERLPEAVERAVYIVVAAALDAAAGARVDHSAVSVRREGAEVTVRVSGGEAALSEQLADRVGALGGGIAAADGALRAWIPAP
jgi:signal transduction histidine kinase